MKAQWIVDTPQRVAQLEDATPSALYAASATSDALPGLHFVTLTKRGVDKGTAIVRVCASLGFDPTDCAAVGDSSGDLPMLEAVGHPFVMGNASPALQTRFPTLPHIDDHGILKLFEG